MSNVLFKILINNFKEVIICIKIFRMIDEQICQLVVSKLMDGYSQVSVAAEVNIGQTTVSYIWRKYRKTRIAPDAKRSVAQEKLQKEKEGCCR